MKIAVCLATLLVSFAGAVSAQQETQETRNPPPMPLEFYGYTYARDGTPQLAFLRRGGRIFIAAEGDLIEDIYRLVRIEVGSAVLEDTSNTRRQTLPLSAPRPSTDSAAVQQIPRVPRPGTSRNASPAAKTSRSSE